MAILDRLEGDYARARTRLAEAHQLRGLDPVFSMLWDTMFHLEEANLARAQGQLDEAQALILGFLRRVHGRAEVEFGREGVATLGINEIAGGAYARGVTLLGAASNVGGPIGIVHVPNLPIAAPPNLHPPPPPP